MSLPSAEDPTTSNANTLDLSQLTQPINPSSTPTPNPEALPRKTYKPLTRLMKDRAESRLLSFADERWDEKDAYKYRDFRLPSSWLYTGTSLTTLLREMHRIRDWETLAELLADWEYLERDGHALLEVVKVLNVEFDVVHEEVRMRALGHKERRAAALVEMNAVKQVV